MFNTVPYQIILSLTLIKCPSYFQKQHFIVLDSVASPSMEWLSLNCNICCAERRSSKGKSGCVPSLRGRWTRGTMGVLAFSSLLSVSPAFVHTATSSLYIKTFHLEKLKRKDFHWWHLGFLTQTEEQKLF